MTRLVDNFAGVLAGSTGMTVAQARAHPLTLRVEALERKAAAARLIYPFVYLCIGAAFLALAYRFSAAPASFDKMFGAVLAVFSALIAFWKPAIELSQADCRALLHKPMAASDIQEVNSALALPSKKFDATVKLIGAIASFASIYLVMRA